jgi:hypothetical protein
MHGLDTGFLVAAEVKEHLEHKDARATLAMPSLFTQDPSRLVRLVNQFCG